MGDVVVRNSAWAAISDFAELQRKVKVEVGYVIFLLVARRVAEGTGDRPYVLWRGGFTVVCKRVAKFKVRGRPKMGGEDGENTLLVGAKMVGEVTKHRFELCVAVVSPVNGEGCGPVVVFHHGPGYFVDAHEVPR